MLANIMLASVISLSAIAVVDAAPARAASYTYATFSIKLDPPGNINVSGIDAAGNVVGFVDNVSKKSGTEVAFAYVGGKTVLATPIDGKYYSFAQSVSSNGIAILGRTPVGKRHTTYLKWDIVANKISPLFAKGAPKLIYPEYINADADSVGYCGDYSDCFDSGSALTVMEPNAYEGGAAVFGLNNAGLAAGSYNYYSGEALLPALYTYENGTVSSYTINGATSIGGNGGVASNGAVVGYYGTGSATYGFTLAGGTVTSFSYPGAASTRPFAINASGQIVGIYSGGAFLYENGAYYTINIANGSSVYPSYINDQGTIAGSYTPKNSKVQAGFIATCATGPGTCTP